MRMSTGNERRRINRCRYHGYDPNNERRSFLSSVSVFFLLVLRLSAHTYFDIGERDCLIAMVLVFVEQHERQEKKENNMATEPPMRSIPETSLALW